ncbi:MAG: hypothetical protein KR126chlam1_00457 [Chlamydiae bacterium]|nr:hypothetical protein [Chlamydiota bacterium]
MLSKLFYAAILYLSIATPSNPRSTDVSVAPDLYSDEWEECSPPSAREEQELFSHLNAEEQGLYNSLDCQGKKRAIALSRQTPDKKAAVQQAAKEMAQRQRRKPIHPSDKIEKFGGQDKYNKYGY